MNIIVKLFGTLGQAVPGYDAAVGLTVNLPDDARVEDLLAHLGIPETAGCFITINKAIVKPSEKLVGNTQVNIFQALAGG